MNTQDGKLPYVAALLSAVIFGFSFIFTKDALGSLGIFQLLGFRFLTAAILLTLLKAAGAVRINVSLIHSGNLLLIALLQPVLYFILETIGVNLTTASESGIVIALVPVSVTITALFLLKERVTLIQWFFILLSIAGVALLVVNPNMDIGHIKGILALLVAVTAAGFYNVFSRRASASYTPAEITYVMMWVGAIVFNVIGISEAVLGKGLNEYLYPLANLSVVIDILYLGLLSSVGAFFFLNFSLSKLEASKIAVFMNLTPVITVAAGIAIRGETFHAIQAAGSILILAGIWGTNRAVRR